MPGFLSHRKCEIINVSKPRKFGVIGCAVSNRNLCIRLFIFSIFSQFSQINKHLINYFDKSFEYLGKCCDICFHLLNPCALSSFHSSCCLYMPSHFFQKSFVKKYLYFISLFKEPNLALLISFPFVFSIFLGFYTFFIFLTTL